MQYWFTAHHIPGEMNIYIWVSVAGGGRSSTARTARVYSSLSSPSCKHTHSMVNLTLVWEGVFSHIPWYAIFYPRLYFVYTLIPGKVCRFNQPAGALSQYAV